VDIVEAHLNGGLTLDNHNETRGEPAWETERNRSGREIGGRERRDASVDIIKAHPNDGWTLDNHNETRCLTRAQREGERERERERETER
jgi:hypothetical protein